MLARKFLKNFNFCNFSTLQHSNGLKYDVVVIGGGHAGTECAAAAARKGANTLLITQSKEKIGEMSCNPSFGGIGKGHLMREIDAMDGISPHICDQTGIHFHILNRSHGPAVIGLRAIIDRKLYKKEMQKMILNKIAGLDVVEGVVEDLFLEEATCSDNDPNSDSLSHRVKGCVLADGKIIFAPTIVITTGTFLNGILRWGNNQIQGGRIGEGPSNGLTDTLLRVGFRIGRLSTGTPPRLLAKTIDYSRFTEQLSDDPPTPFSFLNETVKIPLENHVKSYLGYTNDRVVQIVRENVDDSHALTKALKEGIKGPRYCPSMESKCLRFPELSHRLFLEPEGLDSELVYPQGCALAFDLEVQQKIMRAIEGLENVEIAQPGYGVNYNFVHPQQLHPTLETKRVSGLFLAGQINGTTGYEEAAAQGLIAGANAAARAQAAIFGQEYRPLVVRRSISYIGVMIDDLINFGVTEPYRIFTSRSENRLYLRPDNADLRLTPMSKEFGIVSDKRWEHFQKMLTRLQLLKERLKSLRYSTTKWNEMIPGLNSPGKNATVYNAEKLLQKHPDLKIGKLAEIWPQLFCEFGGDDFLLERIRNEQRYAHLETAMRKNLEHLQKEMDVKLPDNLDYLKMPQLGMELRERLHEYKPKNLSAAAKIPGVNDSTLFLLHRLAVEKRQ